ncbi:MAG: BTAD domain-containing putative transcriptional regulator [Nocardioides sp.]|uniref:ATP-binding protein n=1 Tax=Nocardioides sp. TaxID=35761 RepID=UPI0039E5B488
MSIRLRLLGEVSYDRQPISGTRPADLLASLALHPAGLSDAVLIDEIWADDPPAAAAKALQVLVSRLRSHAGPDLVRRADSRYQLALAADEVDAWQVDRLAAASRAALSADDPQRALTLAAEARTSLGPAAAPAGAGPLADLRARARGHTAALCRIEALALSRSGRDAEALPLLAEAHASAPDDVELLVALLHSEAHAVGAAAALARYERYRRGLADRLGVDPDPALQQVHRELLVADEPIRHGVHYDADELLGRGDELVRLRALVRTGRLTSIIGPGGLGKTRVAHVLAREADQPRVHLVELVSISSPADVVSEVGTALGVRDSVTGRRTLSVVQIADIRARIAQEVDTVPTLLVLDNCEHVLDAVASLVAFLLATTRDLRVVTTSRAPLGIAAERVFNLAQLDLADGAALFNRRARAARPDADLPADVVADIVLRLDGLPLAIELAAARMRAMSAEEVRQRLDDRFGLLRSRDRTLHARHQTLTAVIGWSWDLLTPEEQRALAWLSVFHGGLDVEASEAMLGRDAADLVEALVDQSLLVPTEYDGHMRCRMLETVREYAGQRLAETGEREHALTAQSQWAVAFAERWTDEVFGARQFEAIDALWEEENNLADVLRRALVDGDAPLAVRLLAALGGLWAVTGNHGRVLAFADLAEAMLLDFDPPPDLVEATIASLALMLTYVRFVRPPGEDDPLPEVLARLGEPRHPWSRVIYAMFTEATGPDDSVRAVLSLSDHPDSATRLMALQWAAVLAENYGAIADSASYIDQALRAVDETTTPWQLATLHSQAAQLCLQRGQHRRAAEHARIAEPLLTRLKAVDDALHARSAVAIAAILDGDLVGAEKVVAEFDDLPPGSVVGGGAMTIAAQAELMLARGEVADGLRAYAEAVTAMRAVTFAGIEATGLEPWVVVAEGAALAAHVRYARTEEQQRRTDELAVQVDTGLRDLTMGLTHMVDFPVTGMGVAALGGYLLSRGSVEPGLRLLVLADRYGYNRAYPALSWAGLVELAERAAPGRLDELLGSYDDRPGARLLDELATVLEEVDLTSSG